LPLKAARIFSDLLLVPLRLTRALALACLALLGGAALLAWAPAARAAKGMEVAISDEDAMVDGKVGDPTLAYQVAQSLNATRMRILVQWSRVSDAGDTSPSPSPDYNWTPIDNAIDVAAAYGMRTQLALAGPAPAYATANHRISVVRPDPARYADYARAAAEHFKGRVDRYSIWNEPNYPSWLSPHAASPRLYRALYVAGYDAIKAADPSAQVLIGETVPYDKPGLATAPLSWLRAVACVNSQYRRVGRCTPLKADGYAHHPYEFLHSPTRGYPGADNAPIGSLGRLRTALDKLARAHALTTRGGRALDIYLTESGYFVNGKRAVSAAKRARWLPQQFQVAERQPRVREMLQYNVFVPTTTTFTTGLFTPSLTPLPEYRSLLAWTQKAAKRGLVKRNNGPIVLSPRPGFVGPGGGGSTAGGGSSGGGDAGGAAGGSSGGSTGGSSGGSSGGTSGGGTSGGGSTGGGGGGSTGGGGSPPPPACIPIGPVCVPISP
jgi:hypothetical protein